MNNDFDRMKHRIENLEDEVRNLKGRNNALHFVCIVLTAFVTAMFMYMFIL